MLKLEGERIKDYFLFLGEIDKEEEDEKKEPGESTSGLGVQIKLYTVHTKYV